jgi:hypothetical protein
MSDWLKKSVSGEEDLVFSASPSAIGVGVKELPGPDVPGMCGIPVRTRVRELRGPRTSGVNGVPPNPGALPSWEACVDFCACVPAESRDGEDGSTGSESLFLGPEARVSSEVLGPSREIRDCIESVPRERAF